MLESVDFCFFNAPDVDEDDGRFDIAESTAIVQEPLRNRARYNSSVDKNRMNESLKIIGQNE